MKTVLLRTGSVPVRSSLLPASPRASVPVRHGSFSGGNKVDFPAVLHLEVNNNRRRISRAVSQPEMIIRSRSNGAGSLTFPENIPEVEEELLSDTESDLIRGIGSMKFAEKCFEQMSWPPASGVAEEELRFSDVGSGSGLHRGGFGTGGSSGGSNGNDNVDRSKIGAYYQQMLKLNPNDPLILRNYGKFLHEVEGDSVRAEEYYGRAILASPGDGELLSLYGRLIWDTKRDGDRAKSYFNQAAIASPDDCMVMGSYAQFMWESEEDEEEEEEYTTKFSVSQMVSAF